MPGKRAFDQQLAAVDALRNAPAADRKAGLRTALGHRNNLIVAKAADLAREFNLAGLTDALLAAFDRFFENPEKSDPQCWAKNALSRALAAFEHQDAEVFLQGMRHIQLEPVRFVQPALSLWSNAAVLRNRIFWCIWSTYSPTKTKPSARK